MTTLDNSARGKRNREHGKRVAVAILKELQKRWPHAEQTTATGRGDFTGVGDWNPEATDAGWDQIGPKATQAAEDAKAQGYERWAIIKPRRPRPGSPALPTRRWWAISELGQVIEREARISELEQTVAEYQRLIRSALATSEEAIDFAREVREESSGMMRRLIGASDE